MSFTYFYFQNAQDIDNYPTAVGEGVAESIDNNIVTYWNPIGAPPSTTFSWLADLSGTQIVTDVNLACRTGTEPSRIKVWTDLQVNGGILLGNFNAPTWDTTSVPGYSLTDLSGWTATSVSKIHLEMLQIYGGPFNLNEVVAAYYTPPVPPRPYTGFPILLKRSFTGRSSYRAPGRRKPKFSSYPDSIHPSSPITYDEVV